MTRSTVPGVEVPKCGTNDKPTKKSIKSATQKASLDKKRAHGGDLLFGQHLPMSGLWSRRLGGVSCPRTQNKLRVYLHTHRMVKGTTSLITPETQWNLAITLKTESYFWFCFWPGPRSDSGWVSGPDLYHWTTVRTVLWRVRNKGLPRTCMSEIASRRNWNGCWYCEGGISGSAVLATFKSEAQFSFNACQKSR